MLCVPLGDGGDGSVALPRLPFRDSEGDAAEALPESMAAPGDHSLSLLVGFDGGAGARRRRLGGRVRRRGRRRQGLGGLVEAAGRLRGVRRGLGRLQGGRRLEVGRDRLGLRERGLLRGLRRLPLLLYWLRVPPRGGRLQRGLRAALENRPTPLSSFSARPAQAARRPRLLSSSQNL